ncbi:MAG: GGDEF domain-containing protein [Magnetococcales bacterium]|nr:GGDEF domain-containing protein [Magnetococcales bacterium]
MNALDLLPFIISLTQQGDRTSLVFQLLIALNKLTRASESRLLDFLHEDLLNTNKAQEWASLNTGQELLDPINRIISIQAIPGLAPFIAQKFPEHYAFQLRGEPSKNSFFQLESSSNSHSILILTHAAEEKFDAEVVAVLLKIFKNLQKNIQAKDQDPLTGLFNRRSFDETISHILDHAIYGHQPNRSPADGACLAIFDIDFFKRINDNHGHAIGDEVLILFARLMERAFRSQDRLYRFGGEEFLAILTEVDLEKAKRALERFRVMLESYPFPQVGRVTVSIGATMVNRQDFPPVLIEKADQALYFSKENGRNQVNFHENLVATGLLHTTDHASDNIELWN